MCRVRFSTSRTREREYCGSLLEQKPWFERQHLPAYMPNRRRDGRVAALIRDQLLKRKIAKLRTAWRRLEPQFFRTVASFRGRRLLPRYICHVSRFGPEGEYSCPDVIFVRLRTKRDESRFLETIAHEVLHLSFAPCFKSNRLKYVHREGMIDALILRSDLRDLFPLYSKQSVGKEPRQLVEHVLQRQEAQPVMR